MLSGDNSIITNAGKAKENSEIAEEKEIVQKSAINAMGKNKYGNIEKNYLDLELNKYPEVDTTEEVDDGGIQVTFKSSRVYIVDTDGNVEQMIITDRTGIEVGDYVDYTPNSESTTYAVDKLGEAYTGSTNNTSSINQETELKWRVLKKYYNGKIDLIAEPTSATVFFKGATGYNNGVYVMNDICEKLYGNTSHSIIARSVNLDDLENNMTDTGKNARDTYNNSGNSPEYGHTNYEKWGHAYTKVNSLYPNIYSSENGSGIDTKNGEVKTNGIKDTAKGSLDLTTGTNAYKQANTEMTAKHTYYVVTMNSTNYGDASKVLSQCKPYWVASRYVSCFFGDADFGLRCAPDNVGNMRMFGSYGNIYSQNLSLRPVVSLGANVKITVSSTASSSSGTAHTINW